MHHLLFINEGYVSSSVFENPPINMLAIDENFSVGPLDRLDTQEGVVNRYDWFRHHFSSLDMSFDPNSLIRGLLALQTLPDGEPITIWTSENAREQIGLRWAVHIVQKQNHPIRVINFTRAYASKHNQPDTQCIYMTGGIPPKELRVLFDDHSTSPFLTKGEVNQLLNEWHNLQKEGAYVHMVSKGQPLPASFDDFNTMIMLNMQSLQQSPYSNAVSAHSLLVHTIMDLDYIYFDDYFPYMQLRLHELIQEGKLHAEGPLQRLHACIVKLP
ncbi:DUF1835 domain-containing protein [Aureibacillus halotolerans]|uniref:Uncharacterized protein DUF3658 n=1 Tax=Aureibacillus halotolerans TaxID=1508390 RepID=A0A4R6U5X9_9BACI|nr:DUF1835 domain-containing protein [Aureibacillus halotolerans]TDQ41166.1 uncharacterized protein DUF3658 [Aureibacillus halotolerans]